MAHIDIDEDVFERQSADVQKAMLAAIQKQLDKPATSLSQLPVRKRVMVVRKSAAKAGSRATAIKKSSAKARQ